MLAHHYKPALESSSFVEFSAVNGKPFTIGKRDHVA